MLRVQRAAQGRGVDLKVVRLPDDKDPCDLLLEEGSGQLRHQSRGGDLVLAVPGGERDGRCGCELSGRQGPAHRGAAPRVRRRRAVRGARRAGPPRGRPARPLGAPSGAAARPAAQRRQPSAPASPSAAEPPRGERGERDFLAMCVSSGERGREYLERLTDEHLSSDVLRRARDLDLEHFDSPTAGLTQRRPAARAGRQRDRRAGLERARRASTRLEVGFLELEQPQARARDQASPAEAEDFERQRELSRERSRVDGRRSRSLMAEEDREPGLAGGRSELGRARLQLRRAGSSSRARVSRLRASTDSGPRLPEGDRQRLAAERARTRCGSRS